MIYLFNRKWSDAPTVWIDTETTGKRPGYDRAVQVAVVRFEGGKPVGSFESLVHPGMPIGEEAAAIHGITNDMVESAPCIGTIFKLDDVRQLLNGAQPAAYNAPFDRYFVPPFLEDWSWPWLDCLSVVRRIDRFVRGSGRHKLDAVCARHGIELTGAHTAIADAEASGRLFYKIIPGLIPGVIAGDTIGDLLCWQRHQEAEQWHNFNAWLSKQPSREVPA